MDFISYKIFTGCAVCYPFSFLFFWKIMHLSTFSWGMLILNFFLFHFVGGGGMEWWSLPTLDCLGPYLTDTKLFFWLEDCIGGWLLGICTSYQYDTCMECNTKIVDLGLQLRCPHLTISCEVFFVLPIKTRHLFFLIFGYLLSYATIYFGIWKISNLVGIFLELDINCLLLWCLYWSLHGMLHWFIQPRSRHITS